MIIFIDNKRKFKFRAGYIVKLGKNFYRINGIEELRWAEAMTALAATTASTYDFSQYMQPNPGYMYFVEKMGIDGFCGWALQFPKGIVHGAPHGQTSYVYKDEAGKLNPMYYPMVITSPNFPTWAYYNPTAASNTPTAYFFGERWRVTKLEESEVAQVTSYEELTDYAGTAGSSGIGQG